MKRSIVLIVFFALIICIFSCKKEENLINVEVIANNIEGKLTSRSYEAKDGTKKYVTEVQMNEFMFIGSKAKTETKPF